MSIGEIMPRQTTRNLDVQQYNVLKRTLNKLLRDEIAKRSGIIHFFKIKGVKQTSGDIFLDGVHLNPEGMEVLH